MPPSMDLRCAPQDVGVRVVIDTNTIFEDFRMTRTSRQVFLRELPYSAAQLCVPQIVIDEVLTKFKEELKKEASNLTKACSHISRLTGRPADSSFSDERIWEEWRRYRQYLCRILEAANAEVLPYPEIPHASLVKRELERTKPFKPKGTGYRDALIWESILSLFRSEGGPIYFITRNSSDFGEGPVPHPDLVRDLETLEVRVEDCRILPTIEDFNTEVLLPNTDRREDLVELFGAEKIPQFSPRTWVTENLEELLVGLPLGELLLGIDNFNVMGWFGTLDKIDSTEVLDVRRLRSGDLLLSAKIALGIHICLGVDSEGTQRYPRVRELVGGQMEPSEYRVLDLPLDLELSMSFTLEDATYGLKSYQTHELKGPEGSLDYSPDQHQIRVRPG